jgi:hypothetical protein
MNLPDPVGRSLLCHEERNLMALIKIIEIHKCSVIVSGRAVCLSVVCGYGNKNYAIASLTTEA